MNTTEVWRDVKGYEGYYQVSNMGNVRSLGRVVVVKQGRYKAPRAMHWQPRILKQSFSVAGRNRGGSYAGVRFRKDGTTRNFEVHRLVAVAFIPNPLNKPAVNHIDHNGLNNHATNLEWCTILENNMHAIKNGRKPHVIKSYFNKQDRLTLNKLFDMGIGVTAIAHQLNLPYGSVRYVYRLRNTPR